MTDDLAPDLPRPAMDLSLPRPLPDGPAWHPPGDAPPPEPDPEPVAGPHRLSADDGGGPTIAAVERTHRRRERPTDTVAALIAGATAAVVGLYLLERRFGPVTQIDIVIAYVKRYLLVLARTDAVERRIRWLEAEIERGEREGWL